MRISAKVYGCAALTTLTAASIAMACGTPPPEAPPPPPPDPPIVVCQVIDRVPCPIDPCGFEYWIVCYGRMDGLPLFNSNPMEITPGQQCLCVVPPLPQGAIDQGATVIGLWLTDPANLPWDPTQIQDEPGYGPFNVINDSSIQTQVDSFFDIYYTAAGITPPPGGTGLTTVFGTPPTGGEILPEIVFNVYQIIRVPRNFDPLKLCPPSQEGGIGLFLADNGTVGLEPLAPGLPPIGIADYVPGNGAIYKFRWLPVAVPPSCPPPFTSDLNGDGVVDTADLGLLLGGFGLSHPCP